MLKDEAAGPIRYRLAITSDIDAILNIHALCFTTETNALSIFGEDFLRSIYGWLMESRLAFTVVAERNGKVIGFEAATDCPFRRPLFVRNLFPLLLAFLRRPGLLLQGSLLARGVREAISSKRDRDPDDTVPAQLVLMGVHPAHRRGFEVANELLTQVLARGRGRGWKRVIAGAYRGNLPILFLYKMHGFKVNASRSTSILVCMEYRYD